MKANLRKILSVLLAVIIALGTLVLSVSALDMRQELKFAVMSDIHFEDCRGQTLEETNSDTIFWYANRRGEMSYESSQIVDSALKAAEDSDTEFLLISGDITNKGYNSVNEHRLMVQKLEKFERDTGKQVFVIDGNHDVRRVDSDNPDNVSKAMFKNLYRNLGYDLALDEDSETISYTANLGKSYRLIALDTCDETKSTADGVTDSLVKWACDMAKKAVAEGREPIVMMHHNLLDAVPMESIISKNFIIGNSKTVAAKLADSGVRIVLSGHSHNSSATSFTADSGKTIYDFCTTSLVMYPLEFRLFDIDTDGKCTYRAESVESIDTDELNSFVSGYSAEQLDLMKNDLTNYSKQYLKVGIRHRLELQLDMEKMGIKPTDIYYSIVNTAVSRLREILEMNLYGENSLCELAEEYNIKLPETDFENGWDLATEIVASFYAGGGTLTMESPETKALLKIVNLVLKDDLSRTADRTILKYVNKILGSDGILGELTRSLCKQFGAVSPTEQFIVSLISPLIVDFVNDNDSVGDNSGEIEVQKEGSSSQGFLDRLKSSKFIAAIISFFKSIFKMLDGIFKR